MPSDGLAGDSWLFSDDFFIKNTPSRVSLKMPVQMELKQRESIYNFLIKLGSKLKLDGKTILAATVYAHRYYMRMPISSSKYYVASAAIAISCKLNDNYRQPDKIALMACNIKNPNPSRIIDEHSDMFWRWRDQLLFREELILKTLNFELNLSLPYNLKDNLLEIETNEEFDEFSPELLKNCLALIEILSSLPILVAYDTYTLFGTMIIISLYEKSKNLPRNYLENNLSIDANQCWNCYLYILRLLKYSKSDSSLKSNELAIKRIPNIDKDIFFAIGNGHNEEIPDQLHHDFSKNSLEFVEGQESILQQEKSPQSQEILPHVQETSPDVQGTSPEIQGTSPDVQGTSPDVQGTLT